MHRIIVATVFVVAAAAAERETFTLKDGRTFTGIYDEDAQVLHTATPAGKSFDLKLSGDQIADREAAKNSSPAIVDATPAKGALAAMTPEAKSAAQRDFLYQQKLREADALDADAAKLKRDAAEARKLSERQMEHARRDWRAFCERASQEGVSLDPNGPISEVLIILPRTKGNNRGSMEGLGLSKQTAAKAPELENLAQQKAQAAAAARSAAEAMPHGVSAAPAVQASIAVPVAAPKPDAAPKNGQLVTMWDDDKANMSQQDRDAKWLGCASMAPLPDQCPNAKAINGAVTAWNSAHDAHDAAALAKVMESPENRSLFNAYEKALIAQAAH